MRSRLGLNSARPFLAYVVYEHDPHSFLARLRHFVRAAHDRGISVMPVVWDSCFDDTLPTYGSTENKWIPNPGVQRLGPDFWPAGEAYCRDLVQTLGARAGSVDVGHNERADDHELWVGEDVPDRDESQAAQSGTSCIIFAVS